MSVLSSKYQTWDQEMDGKLEVVTKKASEKTLQRDLGRQFCLRYIPSFTMRKTGLYGPSIPSHRLGNGLRIRPFYLETRLTQCLPKVKALGSFWKMEFCSLGVSCGSRSCKAASKRPSTHTRN